MKNIMKLSLLPILALAGLVLSSCVSRQTAVVADSRADSLARVVQAKDSLINAVFADINAIAENLALIKSRENIITLSDNAEGGRRPVEEIRNDIASIDRLLEENRAKISSLQRSAAQLRKANLRIESLEKMIAGMEVQLTEKRAEIDTLRQALARKGVEVEALTAAVAERDARVESLSDEKVELQDQLNTVYYIVGSEKELRDAQIINKQGFIGRTLTVGNTPNLESFTQADSRLLTEVPVGRKRATVVTSHPDDTYQLVTDADKQVVKLVIDDPVRFWESSRILIISYK